MQQHPREAGWRIAVGGALGGVALWVVLLRGFGSIASCAHVDPPHVRKIPGPSTSTGDRLGSGDSPMVRIPGATFKMIPHPGDETPAREVSVAPFWIDVLETSDADYRKCVAAGACRAVRGGEREAAHRAAHGTGPARVGVRWRG